MRTLDEIIKYLGLDGLSDLDDLEKEIQTAQHFEHKYEEELQSGHYGYHFLSEMYEPYLELKHGRLIEFECVEIKNGIILYKIKED